MKESTILVLMGEFSSFYTRYLLSGYRKYSLPVGVHIIILHGRRKERRKECETFGLFLLFGRFAGTAGEAAK